MTVRQQVVSQLEKATELVQGAAHPLLDQEDSAELEAILGTIIQWLLETSDLNPAQRVQVCEIVKFEILMTTREQMRMQSLMDFVHHKEKRSDPLQS